MSFINVEKQIIEVSLQYYDNIKSQINKTNDNDTSLALQQLIDDGFTIRDSETALYLSMHNEHPDEVENFVHEFETVCDSDNLRDLAHEFLASGCSMDKIRAQLLRFLRPECICGESLHCVDYNGNEWNGVSCDLCGIHILPNSKFWHCMQGRNDTHSFGFDICFNCTIDYKTEKHKLLKVQQYHSNNEQSIKFVMLDKAIGDYYKRRKSILYETDYFDEDGFGTFLRFIIDEQLDDEDLPISDQLGSECQTNDCVYVVFDKEFPLALDINFFWHDNRRDFVIKTKHDLIYYILRYCYDRSHPPTDEEILAVCSARTLQAIEREKQKQIIWNTYPIGNQQRAAFVKIDKCLAKYYKKNYYIDDNGYGIFLKFIIEEELDDEDISIESQLGSQCIADDCIYTVFSSWFPTSSLKRTTMVAISTFDLDKDIKFYVLQYCWLNCQPPADKDIEQYVDKLNASGQVSEPVKKFERDVKPDCTYSLTCSKLIRLVKISKIFNAIAHKDIEAKSMELFQDVDIQQLSDDFLHVLTEHDHLNGEFEHIWHRIGGCDISSCSSFNRNFRDRQPKTFCAQNKYYSNIDLFHIVKYQVLDKIHCHYQHSFDIGNKLCSSEKKTLDSLISEESKDDPSNFEKCLINEQLSKLHDILSKKKDQFCNNTVTKRLNSRYNQFEEQSITIANKQPESSAEHHKFYHYGVQFNYDYQGEIPTLNIHPTCALYNNLKDEMISNTMSIMTIQQFNNEYAKARINWNSFYRKKMYANMEIRHVLSLMIYTNFDALQYQASKTYRDDIEEHDEFYHLGKTLQEAVNVHGTTICFGNVSKFYHGINDKLLLPFYLGDGVAIHSPLSTSSDFTVAVNFTNQNQGIVVEFYDQTSDSRRKNVQYYGGVPISNYLSLSWLSDYSNESECLFVQMNFFIGVSNIIDPHYGTEYKLILNAINMIEGITKHILAFKSIVDSELQQVMRRLIEHQLSYKLNGYKSFDTLKEYGKMLLDSYCKTKHRMHVDGWNWKRSASFLSDIFWYSEYEWVNLDVINKLFPHVYALTIYPLHYHPLKDIFEELLCHFRNQSSMLLRVEISYLHCEDVFEIGDLSVYENRFKELGFVLEDDGSLQKGVLIQIEHAPIWVTYPGMNIQAYGVLKKY